MVLFLSYDFTSEWFGGKEKRCQMTGFAFVLIMWKITNIDSFDDLIAINVKSIARKIICNFPFRSGNKSILVENRYSVADWSRFSFVSKYGGVFCFVFNRFERSKWHKFRLFVAILPCSFCCPFLFLFGVTFPLETFYFIRYSVQLYAAHLIADFNSIFCMTNLCRTAPNRDTHTTNEMATTTTTTVTATLTRIFGILPIDNWQPNNNYQLNNCLLTIWLNIEQ